MDLADTLYWLPQRLTYALSVFIYILQPFIAGVLGDNHQKYATHLWPLWLARSGNKPDMPSVWSGVDVNKAVRKHTKSVGSVPLDCQTIRQISEGLLRHKVPLLFEPFNTSRDRLPNGTYHIHHILQDYSRTCDLERLIDPTGMDKDKIAAVLLVSDIWQSLIKVEPNSAHWLPLATDAFIFPATLHKDLAYVEAQHLKETTKHRGTIDLGSLTHGLKLLEHSDFFFLAVSPFLVMITIPTYQI